MAAPRRRPLPEFQRLMHELEHALPGEEPKAIPLLHSGNACQPTTASNPVTMTMRMIVTLAVH